MPSIPDTTRMLALCRSMVESGGVSVLFIGNPDEDGKDLIIPLDEISRPDDHPTDVLATVLAGAKEIGIPRPAWLCFGVDSYRQIEPHTTDDPFETLADDPTYHGRGTLQERFLAGNPNVSEAILLVVMTEDGTLWMGYAPYKRSTNFLGQETLTFDDLDLEQPDVLDGAVPDLLREYYA